MAALRTLRLSLLRGDGGGEGGGVDEIRSDIEDGDGEDGGDESGAAADPSTELSHCTFRTLASPMTAWSRRRGAPPLLLSPPLSLLLLVGGGAGGVATC
jgi:hypothetical protein